MIYLDIETLPSTNDQVVELIKSQVKAPKNYKDPKKIADYIEESVDEKVRKTALSGLFGQVLCVGYAINEDPVQVLYADGKLHGEAQILVALRRVCCDGSVKQSDFCRTKLIGHNIKDFDIPFLSQRMMINGMAPLFRHGTKLWDMPVDDTMTMFACGKREMYSLKNICAAFNIESPKSDMDGSKVYDYWLDGKHEEIAQYCAHDVEATRAVYKAMNQQEFIDSSKQAA